nr:motility protein A [Candidatus Krumholzibacteria bacterium]
MDIATVVGIVMAFGLIVWSILLGGSLSGFIDMPSVAVVVGGTIGALLINFPLPKFLSMINLFKKTFLFSLEDPDIVISKMVGYAERARREGMLALEEDSENETDDFLRKGLRLAVDGTDPQLLEKILETDVEQIENRHSEGAKILSTGGTFAPAFGMIGTLIGLVNMLSSLEDPTQIGAGMATALITTFYGAVLANAVFLPLAGKLETRSKEEMVIKNMVIEGIMAIQSGDSPRIVEEKLKSFLSPTERKRVEAAKEKAA